MSLRGVGSEYEQAREVRMARPFLAIGAGAPTLSHSNQFHAATHKEIGQCQAFAPAVINCSLPRTMT